MSRRTIRRPGQPSKNVVVKLFIRPSPDRLYGIYQNSLVILVCQEKKRERQKSSHIIARLFNLEISSKIVRILNICVSSRSPLMSLTDETNAKSENAFWHLHNLWITNRDQQKCVWNSNHNDLLQCKYKLKIARTHASSFSNNPFGSPKMSQPIGPALIVRHQSNQTNKKTIAPIPNIPKSL